MNSKNQSPPEGKLVHGFFAVLVRAIHGRCAEDGSSCKGQL